MEIRVARYAGFCVGVKKAVEQAFVAIDDPSTVKPVYCLGHLVHNAFVVDKLVNHGVELVESIEDIASPGTLIISAHGVSPQLLTQAREKGLHLVNTTCSQVKKVQNLAAQLRKEGYSVVIVGDENHPEVRGVKEWAGSSVQVVSSVTEVESLDLTQRIGIVAQTTISEKLFEDVVAGIREKALDEVKVYNTICSATSFRQKAAVSLAGEVDILLVIGDTRSANTKRLLELSREIQPDSYLVSTAKDIRQEWFAGKQIVGITAGASTPDEIITAVVERIRRL